MRKMRWQCLLGLAVTLIQPVLGIFADDAFHLDYHFALVGIPQPHNTFFHQPQSSSNASLLYTISEKGLVAAINPKDGVVLWRQPLAGEILQDVSDTFLVAGERSGQLVSGFRDVVTCWDALNGKIIWQHRLTVGNVVRGGQIIPEAQSSSSSSVQDVVVLAGPDEGSGTVSVIRLAGDGSGVRWQHTGSNVAVGDKLSIASSAQTIYFTSISHGLLSSNKAKVSILSAADGRETGQQSVAVDSEPLGEGQQYSTASCMGSPFLISSEGSYKSIKFNLLGKSKVSNLDIDNKGEEITSLSVHHPCGISSPSHFLVHVQTKSRHWAEVFHINPKTGDVKKAYSLPATEEFSTFTASTVGSNSYFTRITETEVSLYSSDSHGRLGRWSRQIDSSQSQWTSNKPLQAAAEVVVRGKSAVAVRAAVTSTDGIWSMIRNGESQWTRPESLAYATIAAWADNPELDALAEELQVESSANPVTAYAHRLTRHINDLTALPGYLFSIPETVIKAFSQDSTTSSGNKLVGTKYAIIGTSRMELYALDATNLGRIKWRIDLSSQLGSELSFKSLFVNNRHANLYTSDGSLIVVDTTTGALLEHQRGEIPVSRLIELPGQQKSAIVKVDADGKPQLAADFAPSTATEGNAIVTLSETGNAIGWSVGHSIERTWTLRPDNGAKFIDAVARPAHDPVASIGKVLGDRSVLYKYLSPNLALLTALSTTAITIYLIEAVTGAVLFTSTHEGIVPGSTVPTALSENWLAYSFTSQNPSTFALSTQLVVAELYESATPNDRGSLSANTNYSSFSADTGSKPHIITQAYTLAEPISHLAVSQTAQGITTRQLLATLPDSNAIIGIPREILNPRRPIDREPTTLEMEEGLFRYSPILELDPKQFITHSLEVSGIQKIITSPTLLESTSMVLAFGHDVFGTQVSPSMAFDVLGKQFNKFQLSLTVVALGIGVMAIRPIIRTKNVERRWKT